MIDIAFLYNNAWLSTGKWKEKYLSKKKKKKVKGKMSHIYIWKKAGYKNYWCGAFYFTGIEWASLIELRFHSNRERKSHLY